MVYTVQLISVKSELAMMTPADNQGELVDRAFNLMSSVSICDDKVN